MAKIYQNWEQIAMNILLFKYLCMYIKTIKNTRVFTITVEYICVVNEVVRLNSYDDPLTEITAPARKIHILQKRALKIETTTISIK